MPDEVILNEPAGDGQTITSTVDPAELSGVTEYGYGYWFRFLGPIFEVGDGPDAVRFLSTAATSRDENSLQASALYIGLQPRQFLFRTYTSRVPEEVSGTNAAPVALEGRWVFFHYSFSYSAQQANGFTLYHERNANEQPRVQRVRFITSHFDLTFLMFFFGRQWVHTHMHTTLRRMAYEASPVPSATSCWAWARAVTCRTWSS